MDLNELKRLRTEEPDRIEFTATENSFAETITALANDLPNHRQPGYLVIGANGDGTPCGLTVTDEIMSALADRKSNGNFLPVPSLNISKLSVDGGDLAIVKVAPSELPPVRYRGRVYVRVGLRTEIASEGDERALSERRTRRARTFDAQPCPGASLKRLFALAFLGKADVVRALAGSRCTTTAAIDHLASLCFLDPESRVPSNAGILLFGSDPFAFFPGAYVRKVRFAGSTNGSGVVSEHHVAVDLLGISEQIAWIVNHAVTVRTVLTSALPERQERDYPPLALHEFLMNAVIHRSYEATAPIRFYEYTDRIEIQSPGGLYGEASPENFPTQNSYRNPILVAAMRALRFVNKFGHGVARAQSALENNGNPPAEFRFDRDFVQVTIRARG